MLGISHVSTAPASDGRGRRQSVCAGRRGGQSVCAGRQGGEERMAEHHGAAGGGWCALAVKYRETEAEGCLIGITSDTLN